MSIQLNIFLLLFGGLQGLLFSLFLLHKKLYRGGYIFLLCYLGVLLLQITLKVMSKYWLMTNWPMLYSLSHYLPLLYGPFLFLFIKTLLRRGDFPQRDLLQLLPAFFILLYVAVFYDNRGLPFLDFIIFNAHTRPLLSVISLVVYHIMAWQCWQQHRSQLRHYYSDTSRLQMDWLRQLAGLSFFTGLAVVAALYLLYINYPNGHHYRYGFLVLTGIIYWFSYSALTKPAVFSVIKGLVKEDVEKPLSIPALKAYHPPVKYSNSGLNPEQMQRISLLLDAMMRKEKLYLQPELTITDLAGKLQCSRHHLSQILNEHLQQSYYDYINRWRVEEAKELLQQESYRNQKIAAIAYDAGFNSLSTFNEVFKKITGQTPSQYRKQTTGQSHQQRV